LKLGVEWVEPSAGLRINSAIPTIKNYASMMGIGAQRLNPSYKKLN